MAEEKAKKEATKKAPKKEASAPKVDDALKKELEEQKKANELLQAQLAEIMEMLNAQKDEPVVEARDDDDDIVVISLMPCKLNLIGEDGGVAYTFEEMYEEQYVPFDELKNIVKKNRKLAKNGRYYIANEKAVKKLKLEQDYKKILSPEQIKKILDVDVATAIEMYKLAPQAQQKTVIEVVKAQKFAGKHIDNNLLVELGKLAHVDLVNAEDIFGAR